MKNSLKYTVSALVMGALPHPVLAQDPRDDSGLEEIIVTGSISRQEGQDLSQSTAVLSGEALEHARAGTLGDTLDRLPGLSVSSFGPAVGRPIIRGLGGDRIRVLIAGIGSIDASGASPDHATAIDPATAESIEVLRGPSTLLFGNNAVGGVINVFDGRIPTSLPSDGNSTRINAGYGTNGDETKMSAWSTMELSEGTLLHVDGSWLKRGDINIPGEAESDILIASEGEEHEEHEDEGTEHGVAENTASERASGTVGLSHLFENGFLGIAVGGMQSDYGLPGHSHGEEHMDEDEDHDEDHEEEQEDAPIVELDQIRVDLMGGVRLDAGAMKKLEFRFAWADYEHKEIEGEEVATVFANKGWELRVASELQHNELKTILGVQAKRRDFSAIGEEAFIGENRTDQRGIFAVSYLNMDRWRFEGGARLEHQEIESQDLDFNRKYTGVSFSGSAIYEVQENLKASLLGFRTKRAPGAEELLSSGPHLATASWQEGDADLGQETALGTELALHYGGEKNSVSIALFTTDYKDFIFEEETGQELDDLPVFRYTHSDVTFKGIEVETNFTLLDSSDEAIHLHLAGDYIKATRDQGNEPLPRIPPMSLSGSVDYASPAFDASLQVTRNWRMSRTALNELPTAAHVRVDASLGFRPGGADGSVELYLEAKNLLNADIRHHTSFLKDILPEPGRDVRVGMRMKF